MYNLNDFEKAIKKDSCVNSNQETEKTKCFAGAWYHKLVTSKNSWYGIETKITLPTFIPDESRYEFVDINNQKVKRYLDTPSVYLGGSSDFETDIGFGFFYGKINGVMSEEKITFRPFWRTIYLKNGKEVNTYEGTPIDQTEYYFFPGDKVKLSLIVLKENYLKLIIELLEETRIEHYRQIRENISKPKKLVIEEIIAPGNGLRTSEFKIVNAIDQYHNEGLPTQNTKAKVLDCLWEDVYLFLEEEKSLIKVPFFKQNIQTLLCPNPKAFTFTQKDNTRQVSILPEKSE